MRFPFANRIFELIAPTLRNVKGLLIALSGGALIWLVTISPIGVLSMFDSYKEYRQAERLLDCLQEADDKWIAQMCRYSFDSLLIKQLAADKAANIIANEAAKIEREAAELERRAAVAAKWKNWSLEECEAIEDWIVRVECEVEYDLRQKEKLL